MMDITIDNIKEDDVLECIKSDSNTEENWSFTKGFEYTVLYCGEKSFVIKTDTGVEIYVIYWQADEFFKAA